MEPYETEEGMVPRKVAISRKQKEYQSFKIEELLQEEGIDFNMANPNVEWLHLELFDDSTFDDYPNSTWI